MFNTERDKLRDELAGKVNKLSREELLHQFAISRVADVTRLDTIGVPVFTAIRALSQTVAIHAGKGLEPKMSRAGAIIEAIEFEAAEHPHGEAIFSPATQIPAEDRLEIADCFPARASIVSDFTPMAWEEATNIQNGAKKLIPSDLIWMATRVESQPLMFLQMGSNGLAAGATLEDAILSGLYEILERDSWTTHQFLLDNCGYVPKRVPLISLPEPIEELVRRIESARLKLYLFDVTSDYQVPTFSSMLLDLSGNCAGTFGGYGCHLNAEVAAIRSITEAIQARACYIAGARDDLFRRQFLLMKRMDQERLDQMFSELSLGSPLCEYRKLQFKDIKAELRTLLRQIKARGVSEVYVKEIGSYLESVHVVRVMSPQCEPFKFDFWQPGLRCLSYARRKMAELARQGKEKVTEPEEDNEEGEEWKKS
jgi:ribosomal protein S12 methylthiotransferase accessory factor